MHNFPGRIRCRCVMLSACSGTVGRDCGAGNGGHRRGPGKENQDRRDLRPDRPARGRRLGTAVYRRQDHARPVHQDRGRGLQDRGGVRRRPEQARCRHQRGGPPRRAGKGRHAARVLFIGAMRAGGRPRRTAQEVHVDHHLHLLGGARQQELQIRVPPAGQRRPVRPDDDGLYRREREGKIRQGAEGPARRHHPRGRRLWRRRLQGQCGRRQEGRLQRGAEGRLCGYRARPFRAGDETEASRDPMWSSTPATTPTSRCCSGRPANRA